MMVSTDLTMVARLSAEWIGYCLLEGILVAAFAALLLRLLPRGNAGTRFAVWLSALVAIPALPLAGKVVWTGWHATQMGTSSVGAPITVPGSWALYLSGVWAAVAALALGRVIFGLWQLHALRRSCVEVDVKTLDPIVRETLYASEKGREIAFCLSEQVHAPVAIGFARPAVVIPTDLMSDLSAAELKQVLLHEMAHLRRWDDWTNLLQKIVKAMLFFHPAVWWIERRLSLEREIACDDAVLKATASPRAYAQCLTHLAEKNLIRRSAALAQAAVSRLRHTSLRVARILDGNRPVTTTQVWKPAVLFVAAFATGSLALLMHTPKLVAFEDAPSANMKAMPLAASLPAPAVIASHVPRSTPTPPATAYEARREAHAPTVGAAAGRVPIMISNARARDFDFLPSIDQEVADQEAAVNGFTRVQWTTTSAAGQTVTSETFFYFIDGSQDGSAQPSTYHLSVWHVTVLRLTNRAVDRNAPRKVT